MTDRVLNESFDGQVALITAGAAGIGRTIAEIFLAHGCQVHVCDISQKAIDEFITANPTATASLTDVSDVAGVEDMFAEVAARYGRLDVLVNNAGIAGPTAHFEEIDPASWDRTVAVDLNGQFYCTRKAVPMMKKAGSGSIINISSNAALFGFPFRAPYTACKWALIGLTKTLAMELGPNGIRVNAICPGSVSGDRIDEVLRRDAKTRGKTIEEMRDIYSRQSSLRVFVSAQDVAHMALFLASDLGAKISGQALGVDGHTESLAVPLE
jgi:NAD(P)-dependent dehydrogenase (short-subunit alcohol dehydrogenase family)